jgi:hypothetical protein
MFLSPLKIIYSYKRLLLFIEIFLATFFFQNVLISLRDEMKAADVTARARQSRLLVIVIRVRKLEHVSSPD